MQSSFRDLLPVLKEVNRCVSVYPHTHTYTYMHMYVCIWIYVQRLFSKVQPGSWNVLRSVNQEGVNILQLIRYSELILTSASKRALRHYTYYPGENLQQKTNSFPNYIRVGMDLRNQSPTLALLHRKLII